MSPNVRRTFAGLALFFVLFPLTLQKPGLPMDLKADEPAYYLMALSLVHDFDLRCEIKDIRRLALEFPYVDANNLILMSDDGWRTVYFGKPYLVSLLAAPAVALFGADGMIATNMALLMLAIWLGALYLRQFNSDALALLFSAGFFLLSNAFAYVFWLHTEVLCMAAVTACLYLAFTPRPHELPLAGAGRFVARFWNPATRPAFSGAAIVVAAYNKPVLALLGLAALYLAQRQRGWRGTLAWLGGALVAGALVCGIAIGFTGQPSAYLGMERQGVKVESFDRMPELPVEASRLYQEHAPKELGPRNSWAWIFRLPEIDRRLPAHLAYFFVGRHTGLLLYAPFSLLCLALFALFGRRHRERWLVAVSLAGVALFFLTLIPFNWHGGGGFIGNRYFVNAYPAFLFMVTRIAPAWLPLLGYALGGIFVGPILFTPFGAVVPQPTLQAHVRNAPFRYFPLEQSMTPQIPGYRGWLGNGAWFFGRRDVMLPVGDALWLSGGRPVEIFVRTDRPLRRPVFEITSFVAPNEVTLVLGGDRKSVRFAGATAPQNTTRITFAPRTPHATSVFEGGSYFGYRLVVQASAQDFRYEAVAKKPPTEEEAAELARRPGPPPAEFDEVNFLVGASVLFLGEEDELDDEIYAIEWSATAPGAPWPAHRLVRLPVSVRNRSAATWPARGAVRVALAYHWLTAAGEPLEWEGLRTPLPADLPPGDVAARELEIATPRAPGSYLLELDALRERVAWFSQRAAGNTLRLPVEIVPANGR